METFQINVDALRTLFGLLTGEEQDRALIYMSSVYEELQEIRLRAKIQEEAERTISCEAERLIFNRLAGQLVANMEFDLPCCSTHRRTPTNEVLMIDETDASSGIVVEDMPYDSPDVTTGEEADYDISKLTCSTCGFIANNRKALYRHGKKMDHLTRPTQDYNPSGLFACSICNYNTDRKFNLDRHLQRAHFAVRNHGCPHCDQRFKDGDCLRSHVRRMHSSF